MICIPENEITDPELKKCILDFAESDICDIDGDILSYEGVRYYVHVLAKKVYRIEAGTDYMHAYENGKSVGYYGRNRRKDGE